METRANYILVGSFALAGFVGILGFFLWFANIQLDRQYAYYDIDFPSVSGLSDASDVRFAGLPVGQVVAVRLSPLDDGRVRVRIEVDAETPIRTDSIATIESQGVTGVSYVGLTPGSPDAPLLAAVSPDDVPMIEAGQSVLQSLSQDAPEILAETLEVIRELRGLIGGENQQRVQSILENVEESSAAFAQALEDFSAVSGTVSSFAREIDRFNTTLDTLTRDASGVLSAAESTLNSVEALSTDARGILAQGADLLTQATGTISAADAFVSEDLRPATEQFGRSIAEIESRFATLSDGADDLVQAYTETSRAATARLTEAQETLAATDALIARLDDTLASVDTAAQRLDTLMSDSADPLLAELRVTASEATEVIGRIGDTAESTFASIDALSADTRAVLAQGSDLLTQAEGTIAQADTYIAEGLGPTTEQIGRSVADIEGRVATLSESAGELVTTYTETGAAATARLEEARETLAATDALIARIDETLGTVNSAAQRLDLLMADSADPLLAELRVTVSEATSLVRRIGDGAEATFASIDEVSADTRAVMAQGSELIAQAEGTIAAADAYIAEGLGPTTEQVGRSVAEFQERFASLSDSAGDLVTTYSETGAAATARLEEARETLAATDALIARIDETLGSVDTAAKRLDALMVDAAEPLLADLRVATNEATSVIRLIGETAETDLPLILGDIRSATEAASAVVKAIESDFSAASERLEGLAESADTTLEGVRVTFASANETLTAINAALETGDRALLAAEKAFAGADRVMNEDVRQITERLRATLDELETAVGAVAEEIPGVTEELRAASRSAEAAFAEIEGAVGQSAPAFREFATTALPQYGRLAVETRALIDNLDDLVEQIRRDPSRFFLNPRAPEFRR